MLCLVESEKEEKVGRNEKEELKKRDLLKQGGSEIAEKKKKTEERRGICMFFLPRPYPRLFSPPDLVSLSLYLLTFLLKWCGETE